MDETIRKLVFCGDIHGDLRELVWKLVEKCKIEKADVIICGDFGIGFEKKEYLNLIYSRIERKLKKYDINLFAIRGNHDDPKYFKNGSFDLEKLKFLQDHQPIQLCGQNIYPVGGAVSIDRGWRLKENARLKHLGSSSRVWWSEENIEKINGDNFPGDIDIIISHEAPISFEPMAIRKDDIDPEHWEEMMEERRYLDSLRSKFPKATHWFHGHHHKSTNGISGNLIYRGLDIMELFMLN